MLLLLLACRPAAPPAVPAAAEVNIWPGEGIAPLRLGETCADARARLGEPSETSDYPDEELSYDSWRALGLSVRCSRGQVGTIFAYSGRVGGYEEPGWTPYPAHLSSGLTFASRYDDVRAVMGAPLQEGALDLAPVPSRWARYPGVGFDFIQSTGELITISVSQ